MTEWLYRRCGSRYVSVMMLMTRLIGSVGGTLVIYYVLFTTQLPADVRRHFIDAGIVLVPFAVAATFPLALWNTRTLRRVLNQLRAGLPLTARERSRAVLEAVTFPRRQNTGEAVLVALCSVVPMSIYLWWVCDPRPLVYLQITIATALAIAGVLLITFFASERWMQVVVRDLCQHGVPVDFHAMPRSRLQTRMVVCFGLISMLTSVMIAALANQRALDIIEFPDLQREAVASLRVHTLYITLTSLVMGFLYSRMLATSIASRANWLVMLMKRVQAGDLSQRAQPTGNDEIDILARQFNRMVEELQEQDRTVRDLNVNLERKVRSRTDELAQSQRSLQISLEKLRESDRHKTEFFSNISHELRTPLMMILSPLDQVAKREEAGLSDKSRSQLGVASINANRLLKLINQLLDFSKLEAGHLRLRQERVDVRVVIERLVEAAAPLAEQRGLSLSADVQPNLPLTVADEEKLDTIITNLVSNALKFTPRGGSVVVRAALEHGGGERLLRIAVVDSGIGIAAENLGRLFQRFSQIDGSTSREFAGTGLGLALVKELVELHGGAIHVDSQPGRGSCFWFTLPLVDSVPDCVPEAESAPILRTERFADLATCNAPTQPSPPPVPGGHKVLVVDDTPEVRHLVGEILSEHYHVIFAADGESGWQAVLDESPDLIISDVMMPHVDGYELCRRVKETSATAAIPFVLLTARAQASLKIEGLNCGADDYLVKPFHADELLARARALLRLRQMHTDLVAKHARLEDTFAELRQTQNQLVQAEKMSSLGQLTAGLAHEINNAINAVYNGIPAISDRLDRLQRMVATALDDGLTTPGEDRSDVDAAFQSLRRLAGVVSEGADRTARIVRDMKTFSHPGTEATEPTDVAAVLELCASLLENQHRERAKVHCELDSDCWCLATAGHLNQVFLNLLTNAVQAMPQGGQIFATAHRDGGVVRVSIRDTGSGIPAAVLPRIFDPFFTTKPLGSGDRAGAVGQLWDCDPDGRDDRMSQCGRGRDGVYRPIAGDWGESSFVGRSRVGTGARAPERATARRADTARLTAPAENSS
jgi:signal transduction histidine kinase